MVKFKSNKHISHCTTRMRSTLCPKRKEGNVPLKDIVSLNNDQSEAMLPSKEKLTDNNSRKGTKHMQM